MLKLYDLTIEYKREPLGLDEVQPRFSWKLDTDHAGTVQTAYRIKVQRGGETVWDSGETESAQSIFGRVPRPQSRAAHRVRLDCHRLGQPQRDRCRRKPV